MSTVSKPGVPGQVTDPNAPLIVLTDGIPRIAIRIPDGAFLIPTSEIPPDRDTGGYRRVEMLIIDGDMSLAALARLRLDDASTLAVAQIAASFPKKIDTKDEEP